MAPVAAAEVYGPAGSTPPMDERLRLLAWFGVIGPLVGLAGTLVATVVSPTFTWAGSALSDLGAAGEPTAALFNGGLIAAALLTAPVARVVWAIGDHPLQRLGAVGLVATLGALAGVGLFPIGSPLHFPVSASFFVLLTFVAWVHGSGTVLAGDPGGGLVAIWLGIGHVLVWVGWVAVGPPGIAVPELAGAVLLYVWILLVLRRSAVDVASPAAVAS